MAVQTTYKLPQTRHNWITVDGDDSRIILFIWLEGGRYQVQYQSRGGRVKPLAVIELTGNGWLCQGRLYDSYEEAGRDLFEARFKSPA